MARKLKDAIVRIEDEPITDVLGGIWLAALMLSLLHLPLLVS